MSDVHFVGIPGPLPEVRAVSKRLGRWGGLTGDWEQGAEVAGVAIDLLSAEESRRIIADTGGAQPEIAELERVFVLTGATSMRPRSLRRPSWRFVALRCGPKTVK